ncbi:unnamed protein product, partial [Ilex paraguariensis]
MLQALPRQLISKASPTILSVHTSAKRLALANARANTSALTYVTLWSLPSGVAQPLPVESPSTSSRVVAQLAHN